MTLQLSTQDTVLVLCILKLCSQIMTCFRYLPDDRREILKVTEFILKYLQLFTEVELSWLCYALKRKMARKTVKLLA